MDKVAREVLGVSLFVVLCMLPYPYWRLIGGSADVADENREMAPLPDLTQVTDPKAMDALPDALEAYVDDRLPFRDELVWLNSAVDYHLLKSSSNPEVIVGEDGWLFYDNVDDGDPIGQYQGRQRYAEQDLELIASKLQAAKDGLAERGVDFMLFIAPNKERVCRDLMPDRLGPLVEDGQLEQVLSYLAEHTDVRVVCPLADFEDYVAQGRGPSLYQKTDTHWNEAGGFVGAQRLLESLGRTTLVDFHDAQLIDQQATPGDLARLLGLEATIDPGVNHAYFEYDFRARRLPSETDAHLVYVNEGGTGSALIHHDSFLANMMPALVYSFNTVEVFHWSVYTHAAFEASMRPDVFIYEIAERNLFRLLVSEVW